MRLITLKNLKGNNKSCLSQLRIIYKRHAKKRGLVFELTNEQFAGLTKQNCWYCGCQPAQIQRKYDKRVPKGAFYIYNGIDRVDNDVGYIEANCVPCCGKCNRMKSAYSGEDFISHIRKIVRNLGIF